MSADAVRLIDRAYKVALDPTVEQRKKLARTAGVARWTYNWALARWNGWAAARAVALFCSSLDGREHKESSPNWMAIHKQLTAARHRGEVPAWVGEVSSYAVREACGDLGAGWQRFFDGLKRQDPTAAPPRFKSRRDRAHWHCDQPAGVSVTEKRVTIPGIGAVKLKRRDYAPSAARGERNSRGERVTGIALALVAGEWFAAIRANVPLPLPEPRIAGLRLGVEVGVRALAVLSDGTRIGAVRAAPLLAATTRRLKLWQRRLARRFRPGRQQSARWQLAKREVAKYEARIARIRADVLHKASHAIVETKAETLCVRENDVRGMMARDAQASDEQRRTRNRVAPLLQQMGGMYELRRQIEYKQGWAGGAIVRVPAAEPTTLRCSVCLAVRESDPGYPDFVCPSCGHREDREDNSARNLREYTPAPPSGDAEAGGGPRRRNGGRKPTATGERTGSPDAAAQAVTVGPDGADASASRAPGSAQQARSDGAASATLALRGTGTTPPASAGDGATQLGARSGLSRHSPHDPVITAPRESEHRGDDDPSSVGFRGVVRERDPVDPNRSQTATQLAGSTSDASGVSGALS